MHELLIDESDQRPARLVLYSNLPIACQRVNPSTNKPDHCWITFTIRTSNDIAVRQRLPHGITADKNLTTKACRYQLSETDWKPDKGFAYNNETSLDIVAKVNCHAGFEMCNLCQFYRRLMLMSSTVILFIYYRISMSVV